MFRDMPNFKMDPSVLEEKGEEKVSRLEIISEFLTEAMEGKSKMDLMKLDLDPATLSHYLDLLCQKMLVCKITMYKTTERGKTFLADCNKVKNIIRSS